jgi:hypothetical protein
LADPPPLSELSVEPEAGLTADSAFSAKELSPSFDLPDPDDAPSVQQTVAVAGPAASARAMPTAAVIPIPRGFIPDPGPGPAEPALPRVIALATRHPPTIASYPWLKAAQRKRRRTRLSNTAAWMVTIAIMSGMIGVAATYLSGPRPNPEPVAQR